jgi:hypothetical protein
MIGKRIVLMVLVVTCITVLLGGATAPVQAQGDYPSMTTLLDEVDIWVDLLYESGYSIANIYVDRMKATNSYTVSRELHAGNEYFIVGVGGDGITDLDLKLYNASGRLVEQDTSADNIPILMISPSRDAVYSVETSIYAIDANVSLDTELFFAYIIAFKNT